MLWDPPKYLVVRDLYRFNRNPMYAGLILVVRGWALIAGHPWNHVYAVLLPVIFHLRVVLYEEEQMKRLFGGEWNTDRQAVPRWGVTAPLYPIHEGFVSTIRICRVRPTSPCFPELRKPHGRVGWPQSAARPNQKGSGPRSQYDCVAAVKRGDETAANFRAGVHYPMVRS